MSDRRVRYARNGSVRLAYREFGEGDTTLLWNRFSSVDLVRDLSAGSGLTFESLGPQRLKGLPEDIDVYRVTPAGA